MGDKTVPTYCLQCKRDVAPEEGLWVCPIHGIDLTYPPEAAKTPYQQFKSWAASQSWYCFEAVKDTMISRWATPIGNVVSVAYNEDGLIYEVVTEGKERV